jgi:hypothetical protein
MAPVRATFESAVKIAKPEHPGLMVRGLLGEVVCQPGQGALITGPNEANQESDG